MAFSPVGNAIAVAHNNSPYVSAYPWSGSGFGTKYANPTTLPGGTVCYNVAFNLLNNAIAVVYDNSPYVTVYSWSSSGFGVKFGDPATLPTGTGTGVDFTIN